MDVDVLGNAQREREWFHSLTVPPGLWTVLRLDGRGFSRLTASHYEKPFDRRFADVMADTSRLLFEEFGARYAYTVSDEISLLLEPGFRLFGRVVEKLVSVSAGMASAGFTGGSGVMGHFDSRVWTGGSIAEVVEYFSWRQADAARSALHGWCYWTLRQEGLSGKQATGALAGRSTADKNELLFQHGVNFNEVPDWQRRGVGIWREDGGVRVEWELPMRAEYRDLVVRASGWQGETTINR
ncbi:tRNA(His) guanylyltransferase Thg1 family protein [Actinoplanes derwentensis]|uniref:tRNA(His) guanylyltransferase n=1 Tax=Actinoplanes derwentensis TaxID=113562 RepID=A0A1H1ZBG4_9ACTN|nr:tRNA(His) guanylyltransferase Thg1 family protein [Actinoplanes derwentensis]GID82349.1 guanylyltransferase [Actinoplanes derwentensis]SDT30973.1 tRNA(His) 5'-end guanylyltransferase [Actinoplanes derwentensis]